MVLAWSYLVFCSQIHVSNDLYNIIPKAYYHMIHIHVSLLDHSAQVDTQVTQSMGEMQKLESKELQLKWVNNVLAVLLYLCLYTVLRGVYM